MFFVYIIYSFSKDKYYVGHTGEGLSERLRKHNSNHKGFTGPVTDWKILFSKEYSSKSEAYKAELNIKKRKSRKYIETLISSSGSEHPAYNAGGSLVRTQ